MGKRSRIEKTLYGKLSDLDDHLYLLRDNLHRIGQDKVHLKVLSAELRVLICYSSGTEGLLWRLVEELHVSDAVHLQLAGGLDPNHPLAKNMHFAIVPIHRAGHGPDDPKLAPRHYTLKWVIKEHEAVFVSGRSITHEWLIKTISQQIGTAHEDDAVEKVLVELGQIFLNGMPSYIPILCFDAELVLEVGERVLEKAELDLGYRRKTRTDNYGDVSIILRMGYAQKIVEEVPIASFRSYISDVEIYCVARSKDILFRLIKGGKPIANIAAQHPDDWTVGQDAVFCLCYSSSIGQAHAITNDVSQDDGIDCKLGSLHAIELSLIDIPKGYEDRVYRQFVTIHGTFHDPKRLKSLLDMSQEDFMAGYNQWRK